MDIAGDQPIKVTGVLKVITNACGYSVKCRGKTCGHEFHTQLPIYECPDCGELVRYKPMTCDKCPLAKQHGHGKPGNGGKHFYYKP